MGEVSPAAPRTSTSAQAVSPRLRFPPGCCLVSSPWLTCVYVAFDSSSCFYWPVRYMGVDEWFRTMDRDSDKCTGCYWLFGSPPTPTSPPPILTAGVRRGRDLQVAHQSPESSAGTRQLAVRPAGRVRGDGCWLFQM